MLGLSANQKEVDVSIAQALLPEFDHEMSNTRVCLSRIPADKLDWKAHERSWDLRSLATHMANMPKWTVMTMTEPAFDMAPIDGKSVKEEPVDSVASALEMFDANVEAARTAIAEASDEEMVASWSLLKGGEEILSMPRIAVLRSFIMNHMIHHRGQLVVYLRLNDVPVPALYGPSADESG